NANNQWAQLALTLGVYFSIFVVALSVFQIPIEATSNGEMPLRIVIMLSVSVSVLSYATYLSETPKWKTAINYFLSVVCFCLLGVVGIGISAIINSFFEREPQISILWGIIITLVGLVSFFGVIKLMKSRWLKCT
ncbi:hypothetical protein, partial [Oleiphilus sp. HI0043]|uniref:hypothetical protein n=2 Tax=Oleiphilus TaxID=141450 RepID=UPI000AC8CECA